MRTSKNHSGRAAEPRGSELLAKQEWVWETAQTGEAELCAIYLHVVGGQHEEYVRLDIDAGTACVQACSSLVPVTSRPFSGRLPHG